MKKLFSLILAICLILSGCGSRNLLQFIEPQETEFVDEPNYFSPARVTEPPETEPLETEPETEPEPEPVCFNPLNGTILDEPYDGRIFAVVINNLRDALPHANVINADLYFESFVNDSIIRGLALFTDVSNLDKIGSVRSNRFMFNDIASHYDAIIAHAGGSNAVLSDADERGLDHFNIERWGNIDITSFRDKERNRNGYGYEHTLFAKGPGLIEWSNTSGIRLQSETDKDYHLLFQEDGTPADGVPAEDITVTITYNENRKDTTMVYDPALGKYVYNQYGKSMVDEITGETEAFTNVLILCGEMYSFSYGYERIRFEVGGEGWFACGGKAIPVTWSSNDETDPIRILTKDGEPLILGQGNTYIALTQNGSKITGIGSDSAA